MNTPTRDPDKRPSWESHDALLEANHDLEDTISGLRTEINDAQEERDAADRRLLSSLKQVGAILADIRRDFG